MPSPLDTRAAHHSVFAQQASRFVPLAASPVKQTISVGFLGRKYSVLVPGSVDTMPATPSQGNFLAKQSGPIKVSLAGGSHHPLSIF
jgi:hypothetical protein